MNIKSLNKEELYNYVLPLIIEINDSYLFLLINSTELKKIFSDYIYDKTLEYTDTNYLTYIREIIELKFIDIIKDRINKEPLDVINNYLKFYYVNKDNIYEIVDFLRKLDDFFISISLYDNLDIMYKIVKENKTINSLLERVVNNIINDKKYRYLKNNPKLESLIEVYCLINNIDINSIEEEKKEIDERYEVSDFFHDGYLDMNLMYSREIRSQRLLTYEEEINLARKIKTGDKEALDTLVKRNLRLVSKFASRYMGRGLDLEDLKQEGSLGLYRAAVKFDPDKGYRFSTYAAWWINQAIRRAISNDGNVIRIPVHMSEEKNRYIKLKQNLFEKLGYEPSSKEMVEEYKMSIEYVKLMERITTPIVSLDSFIGEDDDYSLLDSLADPNSSYDFNIETLEDIFRCVKLKKREKEILIRRYKYNETLESVGKRYNITRQRVEQIEKGVYAKIRESVKKRKELAIYAEEYSIRNNFVADNGNLSISAIAKKIDNLIDEKITDFIIILREYNFSKQGILYFILRYGLKMPMQVIYKYSYLNRDFCYNEEKRMNMKLENDTKLKKYLDNNEEIIKELEIEDLYVNYQNIVNNIYSKSDFLNKIKLKVSYYYAFPKESRFVYILKESNFDITKIVLLILRLVFRLDDVMLKIVGFKLKKKMEQDSYINIQNSVYKEEIGYYVNNRELILKELGLESLENEKVYKRV